MNTPNPQPSDAADLARRETEAQAAMDAALQQQMSPQEAAERNLRTSNATLRLELVQAIKRILAAANNIAPAIVKSLNDYLNQLALNIYADNKANRELLEKSLAALFEELLDAIRRLISRAVWMIILAQVLIAVAVILILKA